MAIFNSSRYTKVFLYNNEGNLIFKRRKRANFSTTKAIYHVYSSFDRLDLLAEKYYNDKQLWWVFLDANPTYRSELDIEYGDSLLVPTFEEVSKWI